MLKSLDFKDLKDWGVSLEEIPPEGLKIEFKDLKNIGEDIEVKTSFSGYIKLKKQGIEVKLQGFLNGEIFLTCDRCLDEYEYKIKHQFECTLKPLASLNIEGEKQLNEEEMEISFYENNWISFFDILREEIFLSIPYKKLCKEDCKGICPKCGANLNKNTCNCKKEKKQSPFAVLKTLLQNKENLKKKQSKKEG